MRRAMRRIEAHKWRKPLAKGFEVVSLPAKCPRNGRFPSSQVYFELFWHLSKDLRIEGLRKNTPQEPPSEAERRFLTRRGVAPLL